MISATNIILERIEREYLTPPKGEPAAFQCGECDEDLFYDDTYYLIDGMVYCQSCIIEMRRTVRESDYMWRM